MLNELQRYNKLANYANILLYNDLYADLFAAMIYFLYFCS